MQKKMLVFLVYTQQSIPFPKANVSFSLINEYNVGI